MFCAILIIIRAQQARVDGSPTLFALYVRPSICPSVLFTISADFVHISRMHYPHRYISDGEVGPPATHGLQNGRQNDRRSMNCFDMQ